MWDEENHLALQLFPAPAPFTFLEEHWLDIPFGRIQGNVVKPDLSAFSHIPKCSEVKKKNLHMPPPLIQSQVCVPKLLPTAFHSLTPGSLCLTLHILCLSPPSLLAILSLQSILFYFALVIPPIGMSFPIAL